MNGGTTQRSILIVEDDAEVREALHDLLEGYGYRTAAAEDGRQALDMLATIERPCLILLDLMMPVMDGWAFLAFLDQDDALATIPIVIVSGQMAADDGAELRADGILRKPVDVTALLEVVRRHCGTPSRSNLGGTG